TVRHTDAIFEVVRDAGLRATAGKAMMDTGDGVPARLRESTRTSLDESATLCRTWHGSAGGRLRYAYSPRFVLSCTEGLLREAAAAARPLGARIHTHASENRDELAAVVRERGDTNIAYLERIGLTGHDVGLAHCVWLEDRERAILAETATNVLHC